MRKVVFLDRDGVINEEVNYLHKIEDFRFCKGLVEGLQLLKSQGFEFVVITNQSGIARGYYTENDFAVLTQWMKAKLETLGIELLDVLYCPHHPNKGLEAYVGECSCRKPKPGMILKAAEAFDIDLNESILIGDKESDVGAGIAAGLKANFLVRTGHSIDERNTQSNQVFDSVLEIAQHVG